MDPPPSAGLCLQQIQVIHRHGARAPSAALTFPSICGAPAFAAFFSFRAHLPDVELHPRQKRLFSGDAASCYFGQLTPVGAAQMFALGARLRARYAALLPPDFDADVVRVRSTRMRRTVESAVACLSGMFPGRGGGRDEGRAVHIEVRPRGEETMVGYARGCERLNEIRKAAHEGFGGGWAELQGSVLGREVGPSERVIGLRDVAVAMRENGCERHEWEEGVEDVAVGQILKVYGRESWGLNLGKFCEELLHECDTHTTNQWRCKIYSGHDTTLLPLMACFEDRAHRGVPEFAADVVVETWADPSAADAEPQLRIKYCGDDVVVKGCEHYGPLCPLSVVRTAVRARLPRDYDRACEAVGVARVPATATPPALPAAREEEGAEGTTF